MKFTLNLDNANELYRFAKAYINSKNIRADLTTIACCIENKVLTATMLDGYMGCILKMSVDCDTDGVCFITPPSKAFKRSDVFVVVEDSEKETVYKTAGGSQSYRKPDLINPTIFDFSKIMGEPKESIWVDPTKLAKALGAFHDTVRVDFIGKLNGVVLSNGHTKTLVLPIKPPKGEC